MGSKTRRITQKLHPDPEKAELGIKVGVEFLDFKLIKEDWCEWDIEDGTKIRAKIILSEVYMPLDPETDGIMRREDGSPRYGASIAMNVVFEPSESVIVAEEVEEG